MSILLKGGVKSMLNVLYFNVQPLVISSTIPLHICSVMPSSHCNQRVTIQVICSVGPSSHCNQRVTRIRPLSCLSFLHLHHTNSKRRALMRQIVCPWFFLVKKLRFCWRCCWFPLPELPPNVCTKSAWTCAFQSSIIWSGTQVWIILINTEHKNWSN